jgi:hypothetical protein
MSFPLYDRLSDNLSNDDLNPLTNIQKSSFINECKNYSEHEHELIYVLIRIYQTKYDNVNITSLPYQSKCIKKGIKFDFDKFPQYLQHVLYQFMLITDSLLKHTSSLLLSKFKFLLKNINPQQIDIKYGISVTQLISHHEQSTECTSLQSLLPQLPQSQENQQTYSVPYSHDNICLTMIDYNKGFVSAVTRCFWDRHDLSSALHIGCPIYYFPNKPFIKPRYVHPELSNVIDKFKSSNFKNVYITDGCFCSFECCLAFIEDNQHNPLYMWSKHLLHMMYNLEYQTATHPHDHDQVYDEKESRSELCELRVIRPAPSWRLLLPYGGTLSIAEFREQLKTVVYTDKHQCIQSNIREKTIGFVYEKQFIF